MTRDEFAEPLLVVMEAEDHPTPPGDPAPTLERHPLVLHYRLRFDRLRLTKAHRAVEGDHRVGAWLCVLDHVPAE